MERTEFRIQAEWLIVDAWTVHHPGWLHVQEGAIRDLGRGSCPEGERIETGILAPGLVNAHAHLDLTALVDSVPREGGFWDWIAALISSKRERDDAFWRASIREGIARLVATGTTCVGDIDSVGLAGELRESHLRGISFREWIGVSEERAAGQLEAIRRTRLAECSTHGEGLSPHAPYTISRAALRAAREELERGIRVQMHLLETAEERSWCLRGGGPVEELLVGQGVPPAAIECWGESPMGFLRREGLLRHTLSLAHANLLTREEARTLARNGVGVVFCPGTHLRFERRLDPLGLLRECGVPWGLGTDGLVSGGDLDLCTQARLGSRIRPGLSPREWFDAATRGGARVLGLDVGILQASRPADLVAYRAPAGVASEEELFELWIEGRWKPEGVWIAGEAVDNRSD